jgi:hypothetical protein
MSSGQSAPTPYQPTGQAAADANYQTNNNALSAAGSQLYSQAAPQYQQITSNVMSNPYYAQAQAGAGQVANAGQGVAAGQFQGASSLQGLGNLAAAYAPGTMATGYDPQSALYNKELTSTLDTQNVASAQNGVAGSPFAAGISGQTAQNFNLTWEQQQQQRQAAAIAALAQLEGTAGSAYSGASTLGAQGLDTIAQTSALPGQTYLGQQTADATALNTQVAGTNASEALTQAATANDASYLQIGQAATAGADSAAATNNAQSNAQSAGLGQAFGDALSFAFL